jgi:hypothetical protein
VRIEIHRTQVDRRQNAIRVPHEAVGESEHHRRAGFGQRRDEVARIRIGIFAVELRLSRGTSRTRPETPPRFHLLRAERRIAAGNLDDVDRLAGQRIEHAHVRRDDDGIAEQLEGGRIFGLVEFAAQPERRARFPHQLERVMVERAGIRIMRAAIFGIEVQIPDIGEKIVVAAGQGHVDRSAERFLGAMEALIRH